VARFYLLLAILIDGTDGDVAALLDQAVGGFGEKRAALNVVVANEVKHGALGEHGGVVVDGAITKVVGETRANAVAVYELQKLTVTQDGTGFRTQDQKGMAGALDLTNRDWLRLGDCHCG